MHLGRQYGFTEFIGWTRCEAGYLVFWSLSATLLLQVSQWNFLTVPVPILTIIGSALAIIIAFKNQQCYARFDDALRLFWAAHHEQYDPGQQVDVDGW